MEVPRDIDSLEFHTRLLIRRLAEVTGEAEHTAVHRAVEERLQRVTGPATLAERRQQVIASFDHIWRISPSGQLGRALSREEEDAILGYDKEGE
jgi:antitoxin VapB